MSTADRPAAFGEPRPLVRTAGAWTRIVVRLPNWVGDMVMVTPALRAIRRHFPDAHIVGIARKVPSRVLEPGGLLDELWVVTRADEKRPRGLARHVSRLRRARFDAAILFTNSFGTALPFYLARIPSRVGYRGEARAALLTHAGWPEREGTERRPVPMPRFYQGVLDLCGVGPAGPAYELPSRRAEEAAVQEWLEERGLASSARPLVVLNPGAAFGASKLWDPGAFAATADRLVREKDAAVVVLGGPGEEAIVAAILEAAEEPHVDGGRPFLPLGWLPPLLARARVMISTDSGPRHLGVASGAPTVALIGPTHREWSDWNLETSRVLTHEVPCGPCHLKRCPLDHACMRGIAVERVMEAVEELWHHGPALGRAGSPA